MPYRQAQASDLEATDRTFIEKIGRLFLSGQQAWQLQRVPLDRIDWRSTMPLIPIASIGEDMALALTRIGSMTKGEAAVVVLDENEQPLTPAQIGASSFDHFAEPT